MTKGDCPNLEDYVRISDYNRLEKLYNLVERNNFDMQDQIEHLNDVIDGYKDVYDKLQSDYDDIHGENERHKEGIDELADKMQILFEAMGKQKSEYDLMEQTLKTQLKARIVQRNLVDKYKQKYEEIVKKYNELVEKTKKIKEGDDEDENSIVESDYISDVNFEDIGGLDHIIKDIQDFSHHAKNPIVYQHLGLDPSYSILMHGPPGTGKTMIAQAIANELDFNFIKFNITEVVSMWLGQTEKNVKKVFDRCRKLYEQTDNKVVLFVDEAEGLFKKRGSFNQSPAMERALDVWLQEVEQMYRHYGLIVVAATNRVEDFDPALMRRFKRIVEVPKPNQKALEDILEKQIRRIETKRGGFLSDNEIEFYPLFDKLDINKLATKMFSNDLTGSDVEHVLENVRISIANSKNTEQYKISTSQVIKHIKDYMESRPQEVISKAIGFNNGN